MPELTPVQLMDKLRELLKQMGVSTHVVSIAKTGSCYLRFDDPAMGKLRIGDHNERERYGYRWQLRTDQEVRSLVENRKGHNQYCYSPQGINGLVAHIINYQKAIQRRQEKEKHG